MTGKSQAKGPRAGPARGPFGIFAIFPKHEIFCDAGCMSNIFLSQFYSMNASYQLRHFRRKERCFRRLQQSWDNILDTGNDAKKLPLRYILLMIIVLRQEQIENMTDIELMDVLESYTVLFRSENE